MQGYLQIQCCIISSCPVIHKTPEGRVVQSVTWIGSVPAEIPPAHAATKDRCVFQQRSYHHRGRSQRRGREPKRSRACATETDKNVLKGRQRGINGWGSQGTERGRERESAVDIFRRLCASVRWPVAPHEPSATGCSISGYTEIDLYAKPVL